MENIELTLNQNEFVKLLLFVQEIAHEYDRENHILPSYMNPGVISKLSVTPNSSFVYTKLDTENVQLQMYFEDIMFNSLLIKVPIFNIFIMQLLNYQLLKNYITFEFLEYWLFIFSVYIIRRLYFKELDFLFLNSKF